MSNNKLAFPVLVDVRNHADFEIIDSGMTLRDYFAGQALAGLLASVKNEGAPEDYARITYLIADTMLAERGVKEVSE